MRSNQGEITNRKNAKPVWSRKGNYTFLPEDSDTNIRWSKTPPTRKSCCMSALILSCPDVHLVGVGLQHVARVTQWSNTYSKHSGHSCRDSYLDMRRKHTAASNEPFMLCSHAGIQHTNPTIGHCESDVIDIFWKPSEKQPPVKCRIVQINFMVRNFNGFIS